MIEKIATEAYLINGLGLVINGYNSSLLAFFKKDFSSSVSM